VRVASSADHLQMQCGAGNCGAQEWTKLANTRFPNIGFYVAGHICGECTKFDSQTKHYFAMGNIHCSYTRSSQFEPGP
jgi:hypothetical protein